MSSVEESRKAIEALACRVQTLPGEIRWAHAQQDVILAMANGVPVRPGPLTARIGWLLKWAARVGLEFIAAKLASLVLLFAIRCRQSWIPVMSGRRHFFVGIGALKEAELVPQFEAMVGGPATVIDQRFSGALASILAPKTSELLRSWRDAARPIFADLASGRGNSGLDRLAVLTYVVRRLHHYAHFLAVFRGLNASNPKTVVAFSSADLAAYAAVRAGIEAIYFLHGFQARSLVFPDFHRVVALNAPEAAHLQHRLPHALVSMPPLVIRPIAVARRLAIIGTRGQSQSTSGELIDFCRAEGVDVVVLPHPADKSDYWTVWEGANGVRVDRGATLDEFLDRHRPCIIATWYSTIIYDALVRGVVPVSFAADQPNVVFPVADVALRWPEQIEQIQAVLSDAKARYDALAKALPYAIGPSHVHYAMQRLEELGCTSRRSA